MELIHKDEKASEKVQNCFRPKFGKVFTYPTGRPQDFWTFSIFENLLKRRKLILKRTTRDGTCIAKRICQAVPTERPKIENPKEGSKNSTLDVSSYLPVKVFHLAILFKQ